MGVKSTVTLTRAEAEAKYVELRCSASRLQFRSEAVAKTDKRLEVELEQLNDLVKDGEGFENYIISES